MDRTYWHKQTADQPLFPDLLWSRPENKRHAGKLLIIGGNLYGFAAPAAAYQTAVAAGIGTVKVLLPDCLRKTFGQHLDAAEFAPSTPSGSFSQLSLDSWLDLAVWANGVLIAGDLGRNSETAVVLESFLRSYRGPVTLTKDAVDYVTGNPRIVVARPDTTLVLSIAQLQKLAKAAGSPKAVTFSMDLLQLVDFLHNFTSDHAINIIVKHLDNIFVAVDGEVSTTKLPADAPAIWRVRTAAAAIVWSVQHSQNPLAAMTTSIAHRDI